MFQPAYCRHDAFQLFHEQLENVETSEGLFRAAFAIALHERPEASLSETEMVVENLTETIAKRVQSRSTEALLAHLHDVLFDVYGLHGNTDDYYNPSNNYLPDVLRRRKGLPITLVLIYKRVAEPLGLVVHGVNAPGHFLAEVETDSTTSEPLYIDPFYGGGLLNNSEVLERIQQATGHAVTPHATLLARATHRQWLSRMLTNLQAVFATLGQERDVCAMQELQALL